jgi:hypothetical protein
VNLGVYRRAWCEVVQSQAALKKKRHGLEIAVPRDATSKRHIRRLEGAKKGMRYCMCTAITKFGEIEMIDPLNGLGFNPAMSGRWYFCPNKSQEKRQGKVYHKSFSEESYVPYFKERLVPACELASVGLFSVCQTDFPY